MAIVKPDVSTNLVRAWRFAIDVGGTFTDVVATSPDGERFVRKLLSTGRVRGVIGEGSTGRRLRLGGDRATDAPGVWSGYQLELFASSRVHRFTVASHDGAVLTLDRDGLSAEHVGCSFELYSSEPAPVTAIRGLMGLRLDDSIGAVEVRLGTTRATNALLERKGARTALVTTRGFADVLKIGHQDRPKLFELAIRKRDELVALVVEVDERIGADGGVLRAANEAQVAAELERCKREGIEAIAVCLLHAHVNPVHEEFVAGIAGRFGFQHISVSSRIARREGFVSRGDTTVLDAYLSPVIRGYVEHLRRSLPEADLKLMTSSGGLLRAESVSGKDTLLSGPAGGVVGCAAVAAAAGDSDVIGFDMGGTSTDVCRIDGPFEYQHETVKAGVRIMTPMLAVETVAAGGGSICHFDGEKLLVGPQSAGADPGPACYGRGGPLTITDLNVLLGNVAPGHFPFALDRAAAQSRLNELTEQANRARGTSLEPSEVAAGLLRIANERMAAAIRSISTAKGYDVREYTLVSFGGAGGQHACAVARLLGIRRVVHSPYAGVLSALGVSATAIRRVAERSVRIELGAGAATAVNSVASSIADELRGVLKRDGVNEAALSDPVVMLELCYAGQGSFLTLAMAPFESLANRFGARHTLEFGYGLHGRAIEVRAVRVEVGESGGAVDALRGANARGPARADMPALKGGHATRYGGHATRTGGHITREDLDAGRKFSGRVVLAEETSTMVIDDGWEAEVGDGGHVVIRDRGAAGGREEVREELDPIQLELFRSRFAAIADRMGNTLRRTALSTNVKERLDFSCAIFDADGELVVNAPHIPVHLGAMGHCVRALREDVGAFRPGDVFVTNDPFRGGSHLNDVTVVTPVFDERGERLLFVVASRAHHAEIGGKRPGSMPPDSRCLAEEGVVIRAFRWLAEGHERSGELHSMLTAMPYPSRSPGENLADIAAQAAANQTGAVDLRQLVAAFGVDTVERYSRYMRESAERQMRRALRRFAPGDYTFADSMDDGTLLQVRVSICGDAAVVDFAGTAPVHPGNFNANPAIVASAVLYCLRCLLDEDIPLNAGVLAPVELRIPESFLRPTSHADAAKCPAVAAGNVETSQRIVDCVLGALEVAAASQGTMNNLLMGNRQFGYYETICGGAGAGPGFHGADAVHTHMTNTRLTDVEVMESRYPVRVVRFGVRRGSGGGGRFRGGDGVIREIEFLDELDVSLISQRRTTRPFGLCGGEQGAAGRNILIRRGSDAEAVLRPVAEFSVRSGDRLRIETPGGGGYGNVG